MLTGVIFLSVVLSLRLVFGLWLLRKFDAVPRWKKLRWSCLALLPVLGPLFYAAFFKLPPPNDPAVIARVNEHVTSGTITAAIIDK
ncbi:hypothetical protein [Prosthecobacter sp.]|uniref:hypothetical protein n=1 Tax=Prosthecobacter sp. TaxID=1965333 RepID=UPI003784C8B0